MKLSISNIAWNDDENNKIYSLMKKYGFTGLEIAPTKIIQEHPYDNIEKIKEWSNEIDFEIPSMQSIWFGKTEKIFGTENERKILTDYTKKAIDFASAINCKNLVFGCPRNRAMDEKSDIQIAIDFFKELGDYAVTKNTTIGMEANPAIYNTNFINDTQSAIDLIKMVNSKGFLLNLDIGTMIYNNEKLDCLKDNIDLINHVHISEPYLAMIEQRELHKDLIKLLKENCYNKYISIEMKLCENIEDIEKTMKYLNRLIKENT